MEHKSNNLLEAVASISEKIGAQEAAKETARQLIKVIGGSLCTLFK